MPPEPAAARWGDESVSALGGPAATLAAARVEGAATLEEAAARLAKLIGDIRDRVPLAAKITPV